MIRVGLRFARRDVATLNGLAAQVRNGELQGDINTFQGAATAAQTGEPLIVYCDRPEEALIMADMYARLGITRPAVDELTGLRPVK